MKRTIFTSLSLLVVLVISSAQKTTGYKSLDVRNPGRSGGFGIEYNGGAATMIKELKAEWK